MIKKTSFNLDRSLVAQASNVLGTRTMTGTIHRALEEVPRTQLILRPSYRRTSTRKAPDSNWNR